MYAFAHGADIPGSRSAMEYEAICATLRRSPNVKAFGEDSAPG
ncbi:hypothetical protein [Paraburkholderia heleia]|nr:hypothetical protein [Paraburkholderia heleia]